MRRARAPGRPARRSPRRGRRPVAATARGSRASRRACQPARRSRSTGSPSNERRGAARVAPPRTAPPAPGLEPAVERAAIERLGLRLRQHLEARVDPRLHRPLVQQVVAEAVDRADARLFQVGDRRLPAARAARCPALRRTRSSSSSARSRSFSSPAAFSVNVSADDRLHGPPPLGQHVHQARDQLARLAGAGRGLDDQRLVERGPDALALGRVDQPAHGELPQRAAARRAGAGPCA